MKQIKQYFLFFTMLAGSSCTKDKIPSEECMGASKEVSCYQIYDPVCGCNGVTYSNDCVADAAGVKSFTQGKCNDNK